MSEIVGVHGIAQQQTGRNQLQDQWSPALADGLERAAERRVRRPSLEVAFYGDLFLRTDSTTPPDKGENDDAEATWERLTEPEIDDLVAAADEILVDNDLTPERGPSSEKGILDRAPIPLQAFIRALDRHFGPHAGSLLFGELRQVRRYLLDAQFKARVEDRVGQAVADDCRILIGHSLGSVVAFEFIRQNPGRDFDLLITLGSPLGLRIVRHLMSDPAYATVSGLPTNVQTWLNVRDPRDPVTGGGGLARWWSGVDDREVDNQRRAHAVERYLGKKETGQALVAVLPDLLS